MFKLWSGETTLSLPSKQNVIQAAIPGWLPTGHISLSSVNVTPIYAKHCLCSTECILEGKKKERWNELLTEQTNEWAMGNMDHLQQKEIHTEVLWGLSFDLIPLWTLFCTTFMLPSFPLIHLKSIQQLVIEFPLHLLHGFMEGTKNYVWVGKTCTVLS